NGGQALEEYSSPKGRGSKKYPGRCDLYLYTGSTKFVAEAKLHWCNVGMNGRGGIDGVKEKLDIACGEARTLTGYGARRLGMVFVCTMVDDQDDFLAQVRAGVEQRVREQIARHQNVSPSEDPRKAVRIQMQQEREKLERLIDDEETTPAQAEAYRALIELPP